MSTTVALIITAHCSSPMSVKPPAPLSSDAGLLMRGLGCPRVGKLLNLSLRFFHGHSFRDHEGQLHPLRRRDWPVTPLLHRVASFESSVTSATLASATVVIKPSKDSIHIGAASYIGLPAVSVEVERGQKS